MLSAIIPVSDVTRNWGTLRAILNSARGFEIEILLCIDKRELLELNQLSLDLLSKNPDLFRILVGDFPNQGVARNMGLSNATAEWICFWDCDDTCPHIVIRYGSVTQHRTDIAGQSSRFSHRRVLVTVRIL